MTEYTSDFLREATARGFVHQITDAAALDARLASGIPQVAYIGFDATADSLHAGSLVQIMLLRLFQRTGHRPLVLMGGGTTKIGDPSGKDAARKLLTAEDIASNIVGIRRIFDKFLVFGQTQAISADNAEWLDTLAYIPLLRDVGRHFSVNRMLTMDSVKTRLERDQPLSFLEFNYMVLQSYDFVELAKRYGVALQMGGSDQWGNILNGVELIRRVDQKQAFGLTTPLLATASGQKMGKTVSGAVWLNADMLSPYDYWQFWRNTEDADVARFLKLFTDLPLEEITRLEALPGAGINEAKKVLATEATRMLHGAEAAAAAEEAARVAFEAGGLSADMPTLALKAADLSATSHSALMVAAGFAASNSEARKQIANGGFRINGEKVADPQAIVALSGGEAELRSGKRRVRLVIEP